MNDDSIQLGLREGSGIKSRSVFPLANTSLLIYATGRQQAEQSLNTILNALEPGMPTSHGIFWKEAPKARQPDIPVRPGVQAVC